MIQASIKGEASMSTSLVFREHRMRKLLFMCALHLSWIMRSCSVPVPVSNNNCERFLVSDIEGVSKRTVFNTDFFNNKFNWPGGVIPYKFHPNLKSDVVLMIVSAMSEWAKTTCLRFQEADDDNITYLLLKEGKKCTAQVGYHPGINLVTLNEQCATSHPSLLHELGHVIGFVHEHSRSDRDDYITIQWENISPGAEINFCKFPRNVIDSLDHDYDYASIMHYSSRTFSKNGKRTIRPVKSGITFGTSKHLSATDILKANQIYNCSKVGSGGQSMLSLSTGSRVALLLANNNQTWLSCRSTYLGCVTSDCLGLLGSRLDIGGCPSEVFTLLHIGRDKVALLSMKRGHLVSCSGPRCTLIRCPGLNHENCRNHSFYYSIDNSSNTKSQLSNNSLVTLFHPTNHEMALDCTSKRCRLTNLCPPSSGSAADSSGMNNCQETESTLNFQIVAL